MRIYVDDMHGDDDESPPFSTYIHIKGSNVEYKHKFIGADRVEGGGKRQARESVYDKGTPVVDLDRVE